MILQWKILEVINICESYVLSQKVLDLEFRCCFLIIDNTILCPLIFLVFTTIRLKNQNLIFKWQKRILCRKFYHYFRDTTAPLVVSMMWTLDPSALPGIVRSLLQKKSAFPLWSPLITAPVRSNQRLSKHTSEYQGLDFCETLYMYPVIKNLDMNHILI